MNQRLKRIRHIMIALVLASAVIGISSCEQYKWTPEVINPMDTIFFQADIQPIFTANCKSCHGAIKPPDLRDGNSYQSLTEGGFVIPFEGATSILYVHMNSAAHIPRSTENEKQKVFTWINQGAMNN